MWFLADIHNDSVVLWMFVVLLEVFHALFSYAIGQVSAKVPVGCPITIHLFFYNVEEIPVFMVSGHLFLHLGSLRSA